MSENEQNNASQEEQPAQGDERVIDLSEERKGIDVRPVSDPQAVSAPPMGGLAPLGIAGADIPELLEKIEAETGTEPDA